jgi:hypothetical protein
MGRLDIISAGLSFSGTQLPPFLETMSGRTPRAMAGGFRKVLFSALQFLIDQLCLGVCETDAKRNSRTPAPVTQRASARPGFPRAQRKSEAKSEHEQE